MELMTGDLLTSVLGWSSPYLHDLGASSHVLKPSVCFRTLHLLLHYRDSLKVTENCCLCCEMEQQEEKNFPKLRAGFAASECCEFAALSSSVKKKGKKLIHLFFELSGCKANTCRAWVRKKPNPHDLLIQKKSHFFQIMCIQCMHYSFRISIN